MLYGSYLLCHIISHDLSDSPDISDKSKELIKKANHMLHTFSSCDKYTKTKFFQSFCLSLPGCALWKLSCPQIKSLEVTFNYILLKIWDLPRRCHTVLCTLLPLYVVCITLPFVVLLVLSNQPFSLSPRSYMMCFLNAPH